MDEAQSEFPSSSDISSRSAQSHDETNPGCRCQFSLSALFARFLIFDLAYSFDLGAAGA